MNYSTFSQDLPLPLLPEIIDGYDFVGGSPELKFPIPVEFIECFIIFHSHLLFSPIHPSLFLSLVSAFFIFLA